MSAAIEVEACPETASNKQDVLVGLGMYGAALVFVGYVGLLIGSVGGAWIGEQLGVPAVSVVLGIAGLLVPIGWIGPMALHDLARRSIVWTFELTDAELKVSWDRRGRWAAVPVSPRAVFEPEPWPAAARGDRSGFSIAWSDLRGASFEGLTFDLHLSAERRIALFMRGPEPSAIERVGNAIAARLDP